MTTDAQSQNPVIEKSGTAEIEAPNYCIWNTANGANSTITVSNESRANILTFSVGGAPKSGITVMVNGESKDNANGIFILQENDPSDVYEAFGDFTGSQVTITNITNTDNNATAMLVAQVAE